MIVNYLSDFHEGQVFHHWLGKTIFESDNNLFSLLTCNHHPVHSDIKYSEESKHGKILVVGTLVFSLAVGLTVNDISMGAIANLEYTNIIHKNPVFLNDTLYAESKIINVSESPESTAGVITVATTCKNQNDEVVLLFTRKVLIKKNPNV